MQPILTAEQMRAADRAAMERYGLPSLVLMENAARSAAAIIRQRYPDAYHITILCGSGNNGGDGFALARHLMSECRPQLVVCGNRQRMSSETATNALVCQLLGIPMAEWGHDADAEQYLHHADVIVDALLGVGASGAPREPMASLIRMANKSSAAKIALDLPSGLDADTGQAFDPCFRADCTITMGALKTGLFLADAPEVVGDIEVAQLGIPSTVVASQTMAWLIGDDDFHRVYRPRKKRSTKFDYGRVLVVAGSEAMPGAAALCANAAVAAGAGLVELFTPCVHSALFPEVMPHRYHRPTLDRDALPQIAERLLRASVVVLGPGLGAAPETTALIDELLREFVGSRAMVLDADALRAVDPTTPLPGVTLTPHRGEFARLLGLPSDQLAHSAWKQAIALSQRAGATIVLKDFPVQISDGRQTYWMTQYNPALASGGTGDVLSGIIAALWAQGYPQLDAAWMGVVLHSTAGAIAAARHGELSTRASHVIDALGVATGRILSNMQ